MGMVKVVATKMIWTKDMIRIRKGRVFEIDEKEFNPRSMEKVETDLPVTLSTKTGDLQKKSKPSLAVL